MLVQLSCGEPDWKPHCWFSHETAHLSSRFPLCPTQTIVDLCLVFAYFQFLQVFHGTTHIEEIPAVEKCVLLFNAPVNNLYIHCWDRQKIDF